MSVILPDWLMEAAELNGIIDVPVNFSSAERAILRKRGKIKPSAWAGKHRWVEKSSQKGIWDNDLTPYLPGIMDSLALPYVEKSTIMKVPQSGVTEAALNFLGWSADRAPGDALLVYPVETLAKSNFKERVRKVFEDSPRLQEYLTGKEDDLAQTRIGLKHMDIHASWAGSTGGNRNRPIKLIIIDDVDACEKSVGNEGHFISFVSKRGETWQGMGLKIFVISSPTVEAGLINESYESAQVRFEYSVTCPDCGQIHVMEFDNIRWKKGQRIDKKTGEVSNVHPHHEDMLYQKLAWYECPNPKCDSEWNDLKRNDAVRGGFWASVEEKGEEGEVTVKGGIELFKYCERYKPGHIAFKLPGWISPFVSLSKCAALFLEGLKDTLKMHDFINAIKAEPYKPKTKKKKWELYKPLRDDRPRNIIPDSQSIVCLTGTVDTQDVGFWYEIRAWGYGMEATSWQVACGSLDSFEAVERVLWGREYKDINGKNLPVRFSLIDTGGHRTTEVYDFCRKHPGKILGYKGKGRSGSPVTVSRQDFYPDKKTPIPGGVMFLLTDASFFKDRLSQKLGIMADDPGAWRLNAETDDHWLKMLTSEVLNDKNEWVEVGENHGFDCSFMHLVLHYYYKIDLMKRPGERKVKKKAKSKKSGFKRPAYLED